eukprot:RCo002430
MSVPRPQSAPLRPGSPDGLSPTAAMSGSTVVRVRKVAHLSYNGPPTSAPGDGEFAGSVALGSKVQSIYLNSRSSIAFVQFYDPEGAGLFHQQALETFAFTQEKVSRQIEMCSQETIRQLHSLNLIEAAPSTGSVEESGQWFLELCEPQRVGGGYTLQWALVNRRARTPAQRVELNALQKQITANTDDQNKNWKRLFDENEHQRAQLSSCEGRIKELYTMLQQQPKPVPAEPPPSSSGEVLWLREQIRKLTATLSETTKGALEQAERRAVAAEREASLLGLQIHHLTAQLQRSLASAA